MVEHDGTHDWHAAEEAVARLEDVLARLPFDRALPGLPALLELADVPRSLLQSDERARKLLHEALLARPLSDGDEVEQRRTEVESLLMEVRLLSDVLDDAEADSAEVARARERLVGIRSRLEQLRADL